MTTKNLLDKYKLCTHKFKNSEIKILECHGQGVNTSRSSIILSEILPKTFDGLNVIDLGCGTGYMSIGALKLGAKSVLATDIEDVSAVLFKSVGENNINTKKINFCVSNMFDEIYFDKKFDIIIANLPQHALPATKIAKKLFGKYGGFDGSDLVCKAITEGYFLLRKGGSYYGAISELTNHNRTFGLANTCYSCKILKTVTKELRKDEMSPFISDREVIDHLLRLRTEGIINFLSNSNGNNITYKVHLVELTTK